MRWPQEHQSISVQHSEPPLTPPTCCQRAQLLQKVNCIHYIRDRAKGGGRGERGGLAWTKNINKCVGKAGNSTRTINSNKLSHYQQSHWFAGFFLSLIMMWLGQCNTLFLITATLLLLSIMDGGRWTGIECHWDNDTEWKKISRWKRRSRGSRKRIGHSRKTREKMWFVGWHTIGTE